MVLDQGRLKVVPGGEWLVEEVPHGAVLPVDALGSGAHGTMCAPGFSCGKLLEGCWGDLPFSAPEHLIEH